MYGKCYGLLWWHYIFQVFAKHQFVLVFIIQRFYTFTISSTNFMTCLSIFLSSCQVYIFYKYLTTYYPIVFGSEIFFVPYCTSCTSAYMLSLIQSNTTLCAESESSFVVVLLVNWMAFQLLKEPKIDQYVQSLTIF